MNLGDLVSHYNYGYGVVLSFGKDQLGRDIDQNAREFMGMVEVLFEDGIDYAWFEDLKLADNRNVEHGVHYE
mgnify:CR=1 FL=1